MWALISLFYNICLEVADMCSEVVDFLFWEVYDDIRFDLQVDPSAALSSLLIWISLLLVVLFALGIRFNFDIGAFKVWLFGDEYHHRIEDATEQGQSVEPATSPPLPSSSSSPRLGPVTPLVYTPVEFPFERFRATGESFAPSRRYFHEERLRYSPPVLYKPPCFSSCSAEIIPSESADFPALQGHQLVPQPRIEQDSGENQVLTPATQEANQPPSQPHPSSPPAPHTNTIMGPPPSHISLSSPLPPPPRPKSILRNALDLVAREEHKIQEQMDIFLSTITTGAGYEIAAALILDLLQEVIQYLEPFFPSGLGLMPLEHRPWTRSIVTFWETLSPYGWDFLHHPDDRFPEFFRRFRCAATWFGLEELLVDFQYNAPPPLPEPVPTPNFEPQLQEQPSVSSILTPVPSSFTFEKVNRTSRPPSRASRAPKTTTKPTPAQTEQSSNLLNFDDPELHNLPTEKLNELTWSSFVWSSPSQAAIKIWSYSAMGRLVLPDKEKPDLESSYVKSCLEAVAADFKRASIVLRLQARDCKRPCEDDVPMAPLFGEVLRLIEQAANFTERCDSLAVWDAQDQWFNACVYFRDAVRLDKDVWETLCAWYGPEKYWPLRTAWRQGSADWLLLDE